MRANGSGVYDIGPDALIRLATPFVPADPNTGGPGQEECLSGVQALFKKLKAKYGLEDEDYVTISLDRFFEFRRGRLSMLKIMVVWL
jgi:hypothetical protein